ncbi:MAG TPA: VWA domain-containing protein [Vicinamibacterales bacterium]
MSLTWTAPSALWLLLIVPLVWAARRWGRTNFNVRQQYVQAAVRSILLAALALALARPVISMGSSRLSVVYLVDLSHSISSRSIAQAADQIDALNAGVRPAHSKIVAFGADVISIDSTAALRQFAQPDAAGNEAAVSGGGTDLERALGEARAALAPGHVPKIVLFSDGHQTSGDVREAITRLAAQGVPVSVVPLGVRDLGDAWVDAVALPERLTAGTQATLAVALGAQRVVSGLLEVREGGRVLASRTLSLPPGVTTLPVDLTFDQAGAHAIDIQFTAPGDPLAVNNTLSREAYVRPRAQVLYLEGAPASAKYLQGALVQSGFDVTVRSTTAVPTSQAQLDPWDVVILSDVGRASIPDAAMSALADWVEHDGGGVLIAGGDSVYGEDNTGAAGGYRHTELERLMPVTFERKDEPEVALIIVLDKSWSMAGQVMELCKAAAQAAIDVLADEQSVGVVTFNDGLNWDVTLRNVGKNREAIKRAVAAIEPSGHTLIYPAVEQAYIALKDARARAKHVVLLSDGRSYPDDYEGLVTKMVEAKMTVSTIAVGPAADAELLSNIAKWGKGRNYAVEDAKEVPQIFVKEAKNASTPAFDEKALKPVLKSRGFLEGVDFTQAPRLRGRTATVLKDTALELLATEDGDPLLAFWPIGLGRTAVFASDVKDRWASDWVRWRGYGPFFSAIVHALERQRPAALEISLVEDVVRGAARPLTISVEARDPKGRFRDLLTLPVEVRSGDGAAAKLAARQVAPGKYEARVTADARQKLTVAVSEAGVAAPSRFVLPDPNAEYRFHPANVALLQSVAKATGGVFQPTPETLRAGGGAPQTARSALWPWLVVLGLIMWLADVLLRRVRIFERGDLSART